MQMELDCIVFALLATCRKRLVASYTLTSEGICFLLLETYHG